MKGASFDKKLPFDKKNAKSGVKGNTLDYYNDDMSRKAVGKLFSDKNGDSDEPAMEPEGEHKADASAESSEFIDLDELDTYIKKKNVNISAVFDDSDDEYDISLYQGKKKESDATASAPKTTPAASKSAARPAAGSVSKTPSPSAPKHPSANQAAQSSKVDEKKPERRFKLDNAGVNENTAPRAAIVPGEINTQIKIAAVVIIVVFLAILAMLTFKMRSLSASLDKANETIAKHNPEMESELTQLSIWYQGLKEENDSLRSELELTRASMSEAPISQATPDPNGTSATTPTAVPTSPATQAQGDRTHTVARGDTLYAICIQYYNAYTTEIVQKIQKANGLSNDKIVPGQVLKIPQ